MNMNFAIFTVLLLCQAVIGIHVLQRRTSNDYPALIGVNSNNELVTRDLGYGGTWTNVQGSCCVTSVAVMSDGSLLGVGTDGKLYSKPALDAGAWTGPVENSCCIQDVAVMPDGTIVGVTTAGKMVTRPDLTSEWTNVRKSLGAVRVDVFPDGRILGVSAAGSLKVREGITGTWSRLDSKSFSAADASIQPDGTILGISMEGCGVHVYDEATGTWGGELPDSQCVKSIVSPGNLANLEPPQTTPEPTEEPPVPQPEWTLVFKGVEGIGGNLYDILKSNGGLNEGEPGAQTLTTEFKGHYKNNVMDHWEAIGVTEVKLALYSNGEEKVSMLFNGYCTNKEDWFSKKRLNASPFLHMMGEDSLQYFSIEGHGDLNRHFFINNNYGGCENDAGWLVVVDDGYTDCSWSEYRAKPYFMYSPDSSKVVYANGNAVFADVIAIFIKHQFEYVGPVDEEYVVPSWQLAFKAVSGVGGSVYNLWVANGGRNENNVQARELNSNFPDHYKSAKVDDWTNLGVKEVKVAVYENGEEKMYMIFDGKSSDKYNWFAKGRLIDTSYTDLSSGTTTNFFSITGHADLSRRFFVNHLYAWCPGDAGWLVVVDTGIVGCHWMNMAPRPYFLYGKARRIITYESGSADIGRGDVFAIFIKT